MSNANTPSFPDFGKLVPGFDFLQNLTKQAAGSATQAMPQLPNLGNWIAPTLNVEELDKRIQELKAVQFWLDQNAAALKATIQALELQKMTLATLKGMNFNMGEVANAFKLKVGDTLSGGTQRTADKPKGFAGLEIPPSIFQASKEKADTGSAADEKSSNSGSESSDAPATGMADPMQWWGALTQQFQTIAAEAMKEVAKTSAVDPTKSMAADMAKNAVKTATDIAKNMAETATKTIAGGAAMNTALAGSWPKVGADKNASGTASRKTAAKTGAAKAAASPSASKTASKASPQAPARKKAVTAARKSPKTTR